MDIQILAPIPRILVVNRPVDVGSPKARLILAVLAESVGRVVPVTTLVEHVWGQDPPGSVQASVQVYVSRIRRALKEAGASTGIVRRGQGYALEAEAGCVDWHRARKLAERARKLVRQGENDRGSVLLEEALDLWQGEPCTEFGGLWADSLRRSTARTHERILGDWADARIALGQHDEVLDRLDEHPPNETLAFHHMRALVGAGRHTEAIECYTELREHTLEELGSEPNPRVRNLFQRVLAEEGQEVPQAGLSLVREGERSPGVIDTLQADVSDFLGREEELERLLSLVRETEGPTVVQTVTGMGGAGKTTLAVHAAHLLRDGFDVRLQTDLSGVGADQVLFRLLQMMGVPGGSIPAEQETRVAMWRSQTAGRRVLLLLDNASDQGQVAPVVPGTPGSVVLVTSRRSLAGLHGARQVSLGVLDREDAAQMFAAFSGRGVENTGMDRVVSLTGRLPIALRVASSQLRLRPTWSLGGLADRLECQGRAAVKGEYWEALAVFADSFEELSPQAKRTFLCMGLHPTPVILDHAAAASVGSWDATERSLHELLDIHLIEEVSPGRYRMHDLVRKFALQRVAHVMSEQERRAVEERVLEYYLATVNNADRAASPGRRRTERPMVRSTIAQTFDTPREARDWFADCFPAVELVIDYARARGFTEYAARIPLAMAGLLVNNGPWDRAEQLFMDAVEAWHRLDDRLGVADALYELALIRLNQGGQDESAEGLLSTAANLWGAHGGQQSVPYAREQIARLHAGQGNHRRAMAGYQVALKEFRALGDQQGVAKVFSRMATSHAKTRRHELAASFYLVSKQLYRALDDKQMEAAAAMNLFQFQWGRGHHREARTIGERCLRIFKEHGDVLNAARIQQNVGMLESYLGRHRQALEYFNVACQGYWTAGDVSSLTRSRAGAGVSQLGLGRVLEAEKTLQDALAQARSRGLPGPESPLLRALGDVRLAQQRHTDARELYEAALVAGLQSAEAANAGMSCSQLGDLNSVEGDQEQALACWRRAARFLERIPTPYLADVRSKIQWAEYVQGQIAS
ncbi:winged helix-turn-helix domain-containing protein [Nocardiopsis exhalans]|uniref:Winged helix-turn-helix domain-containing protein n=1 Tax=Nocardiopsis exhalans TaxID=163604 RepID=A0ABY5DCN8_9ACTN|nr:BTAD domain-containing putative transcriptional regulator [Nocardiopsis exhalans]USY20831.1 winged helix-turn-helix domain-containing protein [Nocardiopsis exhalans]